MTRVRLAAAVALLSLLAVGPTNAAAGEVRAVEGDVLEVDGRRYRLFGIDAPGLEQNCLWPHKVIPCGRIAVTALMDLITAAKVVCRPLAGASAEAAQPARCEADGFDIGGNMVHTGWALAVPGVSDHYAAIERDARAGGRGLWRGAFVRPWDWSGPAARSACVGGRIEAGGVECPAFRGDDGRLYSLLGLAGQPAPDAPGCVCGRRAAVSICMRGTALVVATVRAAADCR